MSDDLQEVIDYLEELQGDSTVPKNIKSKLKEMVSELKNNEKDVSLKVNKCLSELDEICEDSNLQPFIRTQLWGIASMLEKLA